MALKLVLLDAVSLPGVGPAADAPEATDREPPREFRIFELGTWKTSHGDFLFDSEALASCLAAYKDQGNKLSGDYEHQTFAEPPIKAPASCWYDIEGRADGLWAVNVRWTDPATAHLKAAEYRYFSPAALFDTDTRRVMKLQNIALTNIPATKNMQPLVAASTKESPVADKKIPRDLRARTLASAAQPLSFDQIVDAVRRALDAKFPGSWVCLEDIFDDSVVFEVANRLQRATYTFEGANAVLGEPTDVIRTYQPISATADKGEQSMKTVAAALKLPENATEAQILAAVTSLLAERDSAQTTVTERDRELVTATGAKDRSGALGMVMAFKGSHDKVQALEAEVHKAKVTALVKAAMRPDEKGNGPKISPASESTYMEMGMANLPMLEKLLPTLPSLVQASALVPPAGEQAKTGAEFNADEERFLRENPKVDRAEFIKARDGARAKLKR